MGRADAAWVGGVFWGEPGEVLQVTITSRMIGIKQEVDLFQVSTAKKHRAHQNHPTCLHTMFDIYLSLMPHMPCGFLCTGRKRPLFGLSFGLSFGHPVHTKKLSSRSLDGVALRGGSTRKARCRFSVGRSPRFRFPK